MKLMESRVVATGHVCLALQMEPGSSLFCTTITRVIHHALNVSGFSRSDHAERRLMPRRNDAPAVYSKS